MTREQEDILYRTVFFKWDHGYRDFDHLMDRLREMVVAEADLAQLQAYVTESERRYG